MVLPPPPGVRKVRKQLSADALYTLLGERFARIPDHRQPEPPIPLRDALLSAFAMFSLKDPSLLAFDERRSDANLKALFGIGQILSDTQMREILDPLDPEHLRPAFGDVFRQLQRGKALERFAFYDGAYLLSLDGTGYFSSQKIHCPSCQVKEHKNGTVTYEHQMLAAVIVHPDDQTQQLCCPLFRAVWKKLGSKRALWEKLRSHFYHFTFRSMRQALSRPRVALCGRGVSGPMAKSWW